MKIVVIILLAVLMTFLACASLVQTPLLTEQPHVIGAYKQVGG